MVGSWVARKGGQAGSGRGPAAAFLAPAGGQRRGVGGGAEQPAPGQLREIVGVARGGAVDGRIRRDHAAALEVQARLVADRTAAGLGRPRRPMRHKILIASTDQRRGQIALAATGRLFGGVPTPA